MDVPLLTLIILFLVNFQSAAVESYVIDELLDVLFSNYTEAIRPRCQSSNETTTVELYMSLRQILDINEPQQKIQLNAWVNMHWNDCRLRWNPVNFGNISGFIVPYNNVWVPDITLYDNIETALSGIKDYRAHLTSDGEIKYNFPSLILSICALNIQYFPFDLQKCSLTLGSWAYNGWELNVIKRKDKIGLGSYLENSEWALLDAYITRHNDLYNGVPYPTVEFHIKLKRKPLFYMLNVVFPCLLITFVAVLGFLLPPDSGEKISLQVTVLLSLAVFQLVILDMIPASGDTFPFISFYFTFSMLIVAISCLLTVIVLRVHFKGKYGVKLNERETKNIYSIPMNNAERQDSANSNLENGGGFQREDKEMLAYLESILYYIGRINDFFNNTKEHSEVEKWWNVFSQAFDRLFLFIYLMCTIAVALILTAPSLIKQT